MGEITIFADSVAVHHVYWEASTIVWKDKAGKWWRNRAVEEGPGGILRIERKLESNETTPLTVAEAQSLERLITNRRLYSEKVWRTGKIGNGAPLHVMEIVTPYGRAMAKWDGRLRGGIGAVADIVLGHE
jgi:hypothetical protein